MIHVATVFNEELAELPMSVKGSAVEIEVLSERSRDSPLASRNRMALTSPWYAHQMSRGLPCRSFEVAA
jgi:hypothetical protein